MSRESEYFVGAARADITPSLSRRVYLAGFAPNRTATGVLDPLEAGVLYLRDRDGAELCLVTLDLIGLISPDVDSLLDRAAVHLPRERIIVASTHTHSGPDTLGLWGPAVAGIPFASGVDRSYLGEALDRVAAAVGEAVRTAAPATLAAATFEIPWNWVRNDRKGGGHYRQAVALEARREGEPFALLLNFAAHPEALWERNRLVSPDYPGPFRRWLREWGVPHPLFFSGPLGAMLTPNTPKGIRDEERARYVEFFGKSLARLTLERRLLAAPLHGPIRLARRQLNPINANSRYDLVRKLGFVRRDGEDGRVTTAMAAAAVGQLRLVTAPGEPSPEVGRELARRLGGAHAMVLALGMDELGYILPADFFGRQEYHYERSMSLGAHTALLLYRTLAEMTTELDGPQR